MVGAGDRHATVTMNLAFALRQHLSGSACPGFAQGVFPPFLPAMPGIFQQQQGPEFESV